MAQPCISYPALFERGTIFDKFPFLLPNLVCAIILACGVLVGVLFLQETHEELKSRRDYGLEAGEWFVSWFRAKPSADAGFDKLGEAYLDESRSLLEDDQPPGYRTTEGSPRLPSSRNQSPGYDVKAKRVRKPVGVQKAFTRQVILIIISYGILA